MTEPVSLHDAEQTLEAAQAKRYAAYPAYRSSGVDWLGDVPLDWEVKRLKFLSRVNPSPSELAGIRNDDDVSFVPMDAVHEYGGLRLDTVRPLEEVKSGFSYFRDGDVVVAKITPCFENGKGSVAVGLTNGVAFGTTELHVVRSSSLLDRTFLFYLTISDAFRKLGAAEMYGAGGQKRVPTDFIRDFPVAFPDIDEQQAIARFLDEQTKKIDDLIEAKRDLLALLKEKRQAVITHAVTKGLNSDVTLKPSGVEWLGDVPEHWEVWKLGHLALLKSGESINYESIDIEGPYPVFGGNGNRGYTDSYTHQGHYVLIGRQGALCGNINYAAGQFWASEHAIVVNPLKPWNVYWMGELLRAMNLNQYSVSAAQPGLSVDRISALRIPVPPPDEQHAIAEYLETETAKLDRLSSEVEAAIDRLREYRTALISAAATGKIDVRGGAT